MAMTNAEIKKAHLLRMPIIHQGIEYAYIDAIRYRRGKISVELMDKNQRSIVVADAQRIALKENPEPDNTESKTGRSYSK